MEGQPGSYRGGENRTLISPVLETGSLTSGSPLCAKRVWVSSQPWRYVRAEDGYRTTAGTPPAGFEPARPPRQGSRLGHYLMEAMDPVGIEPTTSSLQSWRSP